jgi:hypothetical protein
VAFEPAGNWVQLHIFNSYKLNYKHIMKHPNFSFDYDGQSSNNANTSQIADSLKNLITKAENSGFDSFWVMDHFSMI